MSNMISFAEAVNEAIKQIAHLIKEHSKRLKIQDERIKQNTEEINFLIEHLFKNKENQYKN